MNLNFFSGCLSLFASGTVLYQRPWLAAFLLVLSVLNLFISEARRRSGT